MNWIRDNAIKIISALCAALVAVGGYAVSLSVDVKVQNAKIEMLQKQHDADIESIWGYFDKVESQNQRPE